MSFSGNVKDETARLIPEERHCMIAEIAALIRFSGTVNKEPGQESVVLETENVNVAKKYLILIRKAFGIQVKLVIRDKASVKNSHVYAIVLRTRTKDELEIEDEKKERLFQAMHETTDWENPEFERQLLRRSCCVRAYIRGVFLAAGSMSNPGKSYHLEIVCGDMGEAEHLVATMERFEIHAKIVLRKKKQIVYLKDSNEIVAFLGVIEAPKALMELENIRIIKDMKNNANRQLNCDSANINKIVRTAGRQLEDIRYIQERQGLDSLPPSLQDMAQVRLEHPDASLQELGTYLTPTVGKSGVNHRLKKLAEIAQELRDENE